MTDKKELTTTEKTAELPAITSPGDIYFNLQLFEHVQRVATMFATSEMIPERYRNNVGDCTIALAMAHRLKADPIMVMQNTYVVYGSPGMEGKMVIALINQCGKFSQLLFREEKNSSGEVVKCVAYASLRETGEEISSELTWDEVVGHGWDKDKGSMRSKWKTMRAQMFRYRAAAFLARTFCPEVLFGMQTVEELNDIIDVTPDAGDKLNEMIGMNKSSEAIGTGEPAIISGYGSLSKPLSPIAAKETDNLGKPGDSEVKDLSSAGGEEIPESSDKDTDEGHSGEIVKTSDDTTHPFNRTKWIACRAASSLQKMVKDHAGSWESTTNETKYEFHQKWKRILKSGADEAWPFENMEDSDPDGGKDNAIVKDIEFYKSAFLSCNTTENLRALFVHHNEAILNHQDRKEIIAEYDRLMTANAAPKELETASDFFTHIYQAEDTSALSMIGMRYAEIVDGLPEKEEIWSRIDKKMAELNGK